MSVDRPRGTTIYSTKRALEYAASQQALFEKGPDKKLDGTGDVGGTGEKERRINFNLEKPGPFLVDENKRDLDSVSTEQLGRYAVSRTLGDTGNNQLIQQDEFELIKHEDTDGDGKHDYTIVLAGVTDLSSAVEPLTETGNRHVDIGLNPENYTVRDLDQFAIPSSRSTSVEDNRYAQMVKDYVLDNVPLGSNVMIVGHSYGADTALDLASDPAFNNSEDGVNVTHVVAAAYHSQPQLSDVQNHTEVLVLQNKLDVVIKAEAAAHNVEEVAAAPGNVFRQGKDTAGDFVDLGRSVFNRDPLGIATNDITKSVVDVDFPSLDGLTPNVRDPRDLFGSVTSPADNIVVASFLGGSGDAGHKQYHYTDFVDGHNRVADDPALEAFYESVADAGYGANGERWAVDISVEDGENHEVYFPGQSKLDQARVIWDSVPGNDFVDDVVGGTASRAKDTLDAADVIVTDKIQAANRRIDDAADEFNAAADKAVDFIGSVLDPRFSL